MKLTNKYYTKKTATEEPVKRRGFRKSTKAKELPPEPEITDIVPATPSIEHYPDSVLVTVKREIADINRKLDLIEDLKAIEKPLQKRLRVLEKCLDSLNVLEPIAMITVDTDYIEESIGETIEAIRVVDSPVANLSDFE
jgi:hypothetical protein